MPNLTLTSPLAALVEERMTRREWLAHAATVTLLTALAPLSHTASALSGATAPAAARAAAKAATPIRIYKTPTCGCCKGWITYLEQQGFQPQVEIVANLDDLKKRLGIPGSVVSCHTATIEGYAVEGHVPAAAIRKLLRERPRVAGIGVTGMPLGSPGMEGLGRKDPFDVLAFDRKGATRVFLHFA
ncbi:MAG TPA: DUF411 domain-containing protein [Gemmatimonadaceae bacterium]